MSKYCLLIAGLLAASACAKKHEPTAAERAAAKVAEQEKVALEASQRRADEAEKAKAEGKAFVARWAAFAKGSDATHEESGYVYERGNDRSVAVWRKTKAVAGQIDEDMRDATLATQVKAKLAADDAVKAKGIQVDAEEHTINLNGSVDSADQAGEAVRVALTIPGTEKVVSHLTWTM